MLFDRLFERPHALASQRAGPLLEERIRYLTHRAEQGMARLTLRESARYLIVIARCLRLADRPGELISRAEIEEQALQWAGQPTLRKPADSARARECFRRNATQWLRFLGRLQPTLEVPHPFAAELAAFAEFLSRERGLAPTTIASWCSVLRDFLDRLPLASGSLQEITITQIDDAFASQIVDGGYSRTTVRSCAGTLRAFFRYAQMRGWCHKGLAEMIKAPRVFAQAAVPTGPSWDEVRRLLALTEGDEPAKIRDRALLLLLAVYGLRASEVVRLRLDDLDWERELLTVTRSKSGRPRTYPLAHSVGEAILRYLKQARPRTTNWREVFLSRTAPIRPLHRCCLYVIVARRLRAVNPALARFGPHALRHACATHLLEQGLSLKEIGEHLGHRDPDTTRIYAKVNLQALREVADIDLGGLL